MNGYKSVDSMSQKMYNYKIGDRVVGYNPDYAVWSNNPTCGVIDSFVDFNGNPGAYIKTEDGGRFKWNFKYLHREEIWNSPLRKALEEGEESETLD